MTLQEFLPDIISSNSDRSGEDLCCQRRKSLNDISKIRANNYSNNIIINSNTINNREENILHRSLRNFEGILHNQVSHPCETETDIELQIVLNKPSTPPPCQRCSSDPFPFSNPGLNQSHLGPGADETDGPNSDSIESPASRENTNGAAGEDIDAAADSGEDGVMRDEAKNRLQRSFTELFHKHLPELSADASQQDEPDEKMCHELVKGLKEIADNFDRGHKGKNPIQALQETLNINLPQLLLPYWLQQGVGPALAKATLKAVLQYNRL